MIRIAHLSDCHIGPLPRVKPSHLMGKRITGYLNWLRHRSHIHKREVLDTLCLDVLDQSPDHIAVTGDLVNLALPEEFVTALEWLKSIGNPENVSLVPGNHDAYVEIDKPHGMWLWEAYMQTDLLGQKLAGQEARQFPFLRYLGGDVALIGLSSAIATPFFKASGTVGDMQMERLQKIVGELRQKDIFCVILIHHPPVSGMIKSSRALTDADKLTGILRQVASGIVLHGHNHQNSVLMLDTEAGRLPVVGVPSASCAELGREPLARYNILEIERSGNGWSCSITGRSWEKQGNTIKKHDSVFLR